MNTPNRAAVTGSESADNIKQCCARLYESDFAKILLGDSFHPGGLALTERLGVLLDLGPNSRVLDVASGTGNSAIFPRRSVLDAQSPASITASGMFDMANEAATNKGLSDCGAL